MKKGVVFVGALLIILILLAIRVHAAEPENYSEGDLRELLKQRQVIKESSESVWWLQLSTTEWNPRSFRTRCMRF